MGHDERVKAAMKGELVSFLVATAREFATRRARRATDDDTPLPFGRGWGEVDYGASIYYGKWWELCDFSNEGRPCYTKQARGLYLYYRALEKRWVIAEQIVPSGTVQSATRGPRIEGPWQTYSGWEGDEAMRVTEVRNVSGHGGAALLVAGCRGQGGYEPTAAENGQYLLQPSYDDVNGKPHYIMGEIGRGRRHIFWLERVPGMGDRGRWALAPLCNDSEGLLSVSETIELTGRWCRRAPPLKEKGEFEMRRRGAAAAAGDAAAADDGDGGDDGDDDGALAVELIAWNDSNHECVLFSSSADHACFLSLDPKAMRSAVHPHLLEHLEANGVRIGEGLEALNARHHQVLGALTGVARGRDEAAALLSGRYCLTGDSLLKMLAIFVRVRCGIPVVLMGECGCGKTMLIQYLCAWLGAAFLTLDVHGGTAAHEIIATLERAEALAAAADADGGAAEVWVFFDELNTCAHVSLMAEAATHHSCFGRPLHPRVRILAAVNPYRRRPEADLADAPGLVYTLHGDGGDGAAPPDPMAALVYRVHPVPHSLQQFVFDFGALSDDQEAQYVRAMLGHRLGALKKEGFAMTLPIDAQLALQLLLASQAHVRALERDASAVSLRDVRRCCDLLGWFAAHLVPRAASAKAKVTPLAAAMVLALSFVYYYRLPHAAAREAYWSKLVATLTYQRTGSEAKFAKSGFAGFAQDGAFARCLAQVQKRFAANVEVEPGVAMNQALTENLFVGLVCILNKLPLFIVGKPGTSKRSRCR